MIHYRCHQEDFAVCGATVTDENASDDEAKATCPECTHVNLDARQSEGGVEPDECSECGDTTESMNYVPADKAWYCTLCGYANMN